MAELADLLDRAGDLKRELVRFGESKRFQRDLQAYLRKELGELTRPDVDDEINAIDRFLLQHRLPDGRTVVGYFVEERQDLTDSDRAIQNAMGERSFVWERDAESYLRRFKAEYMDRVHLPSVIPLSDRLTRPHPDRPRSAAPAPAGRRPGRNDPCPCGSGKKYKRCCGA